MTDKHADARISTGVEGLDAILGGGLPRNHVYLLEGTPGTGKTTIALQFLLEGLRLGETGLYITLSETKAELLDVARSHGWSLDGLHIYDLAASEQSAVPEDQYTLFHPSEVELVETTKAIFDEVGRLQPSRVILDSLSEMRLQAREPLRYRRQILALKQFFLGKQSTVLLLDDHTAEASDRLLESIVHGVILLDQNSPGYGAARRTLFVSKLRGVKYRSGYHNLNIETGGVVVHPRLVAAEHHADVEFEAISSNVEALDALIGGGLDAGTATLILGPAGSGKTTLAAQFAFAAAARGGQVAIFAFDESVNTLLKRTSTIGIDLRKHTATGRCKIKQVDPAELSAGEFSFMVRQAVEQDKANVVVIDTVNGYFQAMPEERFLTAHMHELLTYLGQQGVLTLLILSQHGIVGGMQVPVDLSYLADTVLMLRYFEAGGEVRQALSVVKKRTGSHERTIREFRITSQGIEVGRPLKEFMGVLTGVPKYVGGAGPLLASDDDDSK
ncbi:MAG TPA: ATPase domain-containing protein [Blastocatellia bacterium]|nr:ATPase domain-containing protein [Blastocatellia bacterium]